MKAQLSPSANDPCTVRDCHFLTGYIHTAAGVRLQVMHWQPRREPEASALPMLFVAGWVSSVSGWADFIRQVASHRPVYYLETREKSSALLDSTVTRVDDFTIARHSADIAAVCQALFADGQVVLVGSSLGATAIVEALKHGGIRPAATFLIGPNARFRFPLWGKLIIRFPAAVYHVLKYAVIWYLRHFRVNSKQEPEQIGRYESTLHQAHPLRIKRSAQGVEHYRIWPQLETIDVPVAIAHAPSDKLHEADDIEQLCRHIPQVQLVECPNNLYMHDQRIVSDIEAFLGRIGLAG